MRQRSSLFSASSLCQGFALSEWKTTPAPHRTSQFQYSLRSTPKSYENPLSRFIPSDQERAFLNTKEQCAHFSRFSGSSVAAPSLSVNNIKSADEGSRNHLQVQIISTENVKPASPTPQNLRAYEASIFDIMSPHNYIHFVYFYQNDFYPHPLIHDLEYSVSTRRQLLKKSLSETLTRFYPFAGKVEGERHIHCNDDGVYYVEAEINYPLSKFLKDPEYKYTHQLFPFHPCSEKLLSQTHVAMIQVTTFSCGGIAIGVTTSHRIVDGYSHMTFLKAWAETARGGPTQDIIRPDFTSPSIFVPNIPQPADAGLALMPFFLNQNKCVINRFLFSERSTLALKKKAGGSSRAMAVTALIWKCAMAASKSSSKSIHRRTYNLMLPVNFRKRSIPPLPPYSIGNLCWLTAAQCCVDNDQDLGLSSLAQLLKNATDKVNGDFVEKMKGKEGNLKVGEHLKDMSKFHSDENARYMVVTSLYNGGAYEADFGWGKPVWVSIGSAGADLPFLRNTVCLMDTRSKAGIEAWVSLTEREMAFFENDPELLAFASVNPSPLDHQTIE